MANRKPPEDPLPDDQEDIEEEQADGALDGMFDEDRPLTTGWLRERLGGVGVDDPRLVAKKTQLLDRLYNTPIFAAAEVEGAEQWLIEKRNDTTGQADFLGQAHLKISLPTFIEKYLPAMPKKGEDAADFYFTPMDKLGNKLGTPGKPHTLSIPWFNEFLLKARERTSTDSILGGGDNAVAALLLKQNEELGARLARAEERAAQAQEASVKAQLQRSESIQQDLGAMYAQVGKIQNEGFTSVLTAQERMALDREKREDERRRREEEERKAGLERLREETKAERERIKAETEAALAKQRADADAALDRQKADNAARIAEIDKKAELEAKRIDAEIEKAKAATQVERDRIRDDRDREDRRRVEVDKERQDARDREEKRQADDRARRDALESSERARRDAMDATERERARDHALAMEKMRQEALADARAALQREGDRQKEHQTLIIGTLKGESGGNGLGILGKVFDALGMTPSDAMEKAKEFLSGESSVGIEIVKGISELGKEVIKRLPAPDDDEEGDEEEEEEEAAEVEAKRRARRKKRKALEDKQAAADDAKKQEKKEVEVPTETTETSSGPSLEDFMARRTPDGPEAVSGVVPPAPAIPLAEARAGRDAAARLVERLKAATPDTWGAAVMASDDVDALLRYVGRVGLLRALDGQDIDIPKVGETLVALSLFPAPPMNPAPLKAG